MAVLKGRVALVTGGSRGIGRAIAISLAEAGAAVAVNYVTKAAEAKAVVAAIHKQGGRAIEVGADVSKPAAVKGMVTGVERELGPIDVLINNAGIALNRSIDSTLILIIDSFSRPSGTFFHWANNKPDSSCRAGLLAD